MWRFPRGVFVATSLILLALTPGAAAEEAEISLSAALPLGFSGATETAAAQPTLLLESLDGEVHWQARADQLELVHVEQWSEVTEGGITGASPQSGVRMRELTTADARLVLTQRLPGFTGLAWADTVGASTIAGLPPDRLDDSLASAVDLRIFRLGGPLTITAPGDDGGVLAGTVLGKPIPFQHTLEAGLLQAQAAAATHHLSGALSGYLTGATVLLTHAGGERAWTLEEELQERPGTLFIPGQGWTGPGTHIERVQQYLQFAASDGWLDVAAAGSPVAIFSHSIASQVDGRVTLPEASGSVTFADGTSRLFSGTTLALGGQSALTVTGSDDMRRATVAGQGDVAYVASATGVEQFSSAAAVATAAGMTVFAAVALLVWKMGGAAAITLFSRVSKSKTLDHDTRAALYALVIAQPGSTPHDLVTATGIGWSTVMYHLGVLERNELVIGMKDGRYRRFFDRASGKFSNGRKDVVAVMKNETSATIARLVRDEPGQVQRRMAERFGLAASSIHWHVSRLVAVGLVEKRRAGQRVELYPGSAWTVLADDAAGDLGAASPLPDAAATVDPVPRSQSGAIPNQG